jgi:glycosyltransferase involved in cell wall biosynthesis
MKITYLAFEHLGSGLFKSQILEQLQAMVNQSEALEFNLIVINPIWKLLSSKKHLKEIKNIYSEKIQITYLPLLPPFRYSMKRVWLTKITYFWLIVVAKLFVRIKGQVIHCRGYWPTMIATRLYDIPIVFDLRSLYPAESIAAGIFKEHSREYNHWLDIERKCIRKSSICTAVSISMLEYIYKIEPTANAKLVPISVNTSDIYYNHDEGVIIRNALNWNDQCIAVYSGSLGYYGLNAKSFQRMVIKLAKSIDNIRFLVLSSNNREEFERIFKDANVPTGNYYICSVSSNELYKWLSSSNIGIHALPIQIDSSTRLGTKVVEYWASGLPVVVNENVGDAVKYVNKYDLGYVIDENEDNIDVIKRVVARLMQLDRALIAETCKSFFDLEIISKLYIALYSQCTKGVK